ncbi:MAG: MurR/RpiR family transcriptional regulator [Candidatus Puniceispirillaceae bacterium]
MDGRGTVSHLAELEELKKDISSQQEQLPRRLRAIANFTLANPEQVALSTLSELSDSTDLHPSSFVRFAKHFGFRGFSQMQDVFQRSVKDNWPSYQSRIERLELSESDDLLDAMISSSIQSAMSLSDIIDRELAKKASIAISKANTVWLCASGRSRPVTLYLEHMFTRLGIRSQHLSIGEKQLGFEAELISANDVIMAVSFKSYSKTTEYIVDKARSENWPSICITDGPQSPLDYGHVFHVREHDLAGFRPLSAVMVLAQYLAVTAGQRKEKAVKGTL